MVQIDSVVLYHDILTTDVQTIFVGSKENSYLDLMIERAKLFFLSRGLGLRSNDRRPRLNGCIFV